ncbi:HPr family phosphocarrier protein [Paenibacillus antarcticus]|uniref:PTS maltose transporter subunit IIBC n=1 Tax=Paenibacillus antarcticus TaxID=253703 RepID=A0A168Q6M0_9BACL|nr:HPr family phosphocarrier protein [Paenibacillus antarcticus]OAB47440.1 PTS maltose transporter subunit IIBC [Paenibacillus antarcticus]
MVSKTFLMIDPNGFHAGPTNELVYTANQYLDCAIFGEHEGLRVTLHSILGVLSLSIRAGHVLTISVDGPNEEMAMKALQSVIECQEIGILKK